MFTHYSVIAVRGYLVRKGDRSSETTKGDRTPYNDRSVWYLVLRAIGLFYSSDRNS